VHPLLTHCVPLTSNGALCWVLVGRLLLLSTGRRWTSRVDHATGKRGASREGREVPCQVREHGLEIRNGKGAWTKQVEVLLNQMPTCAYPWRLCSRGS
jgi:hypothetical protein